MCGDWDRGWSPGQQWLDDLRCSHRATLCAAAVAALAAAAVASAAAVAAATLAAAVAAATLATSVTVHLLAPDWQLRSVQTIWCGPLCVVFGHGRRLERSKGWTHFRRTYGR